MGSGPMLYIYPGNGGLTHLCVCVCRCIFSGKRRYRDEGDFDKSFALKESILLDLPRKPTSMYSKVTLRFE